MAATYTLAAQAGYVSIYPTPQTTGALNAALAGGPATAQYFANSFPIAEFAEFVNQAGPGVWQSRSLPNGCPSVFASNGPSSFTLNLDADFNAIMAMSTISGTPVIGTVTGSFAYQNQTGWQVTIPITVTSVVGAIGFTQIGLTGLKALFSTVMQAIMKGIRKLFGGSSQVTDLSTAAELGADAAEEVAVDAVEVTDVDLLTLVAGPAGFVLAAVLIAIPIALNFVAHPSSQMLKIVNATPYDIYWQPPWFDHGMISMAPVTQPGSDAYQFKIPAAGSISPGIGLNPVSVMFEANFTIVSGSDWNGIGYVMPFTLQEPNPPQEPNKVVVVAEAQILFNIPWSGTNYLFGMFGAGDPQQTWNQFKKEIPPTTQFVAKGGPNLTMTMTYDYLSGEHETPTGSNQYFYTSLIEFSVTS